MAEVVEQQEESFEVGDSFAEVEKEEKVEENAEDDNVKEEEKEENNVAGDDDDDAVGDINRCILISKE